MFFVFEFSRVFRGSGGRDRESFLGWWTKPDDIILLNDKAIQRWCCYCGQFKILFVRFFSLKRDFEIKQEKEKHDRLYFY